MQTWPFSFRSSGSGMPSQSFQIPRSAAPCDVIRAGAVASPGHVTSTAKVKVKVKVKGGADSSSQLPSSLTTTC